MGKDAHDKGPRRLIPCLSGVKSEYKKLCDELGGPADIGVTIKKSTMETYCREYPSHRILPVLLQYRSDESLALKHWPWAALAISMYDYETKEQTGYSDEPTPQGVVHLLSQIEQSARNLNSGLCRLQSLSNRLRDPTAPHRRSHLGWLDAFISQAAAGFPSNNVNEDGQFLLVVHSAKMDFLKRLAELEGTAKVAAQRTDRILLERERGQSNPALSNFVVRCKAIWGSLTGRKPSANKVHRNDREDPDFVVFLQKLASVGGAPEPTRNQVAVCMRNLTPATTGENSS